VENDSNVYAFLHLGLGPPWSRHRSRTTIPLTSRPRRFQSCLDRCDCVRKFVSLLAEGRWSLPKCIVFSLPPIITVRHHITEKLLSMAKNSKTINQPSWISVTHFILIRFYLRNWVCIIIFITRNQFVCTPHCIEEAINFKKK
jgi:hypothetical protein